MTRRRWLNPLLDAAVFALVAAVQLYALLGGPGADRPPAVNDAMEVYDIGWNLAHGRGYGFDWDAADIRQPWAAGDTPAYTRDGYDEHPLARQLAHRGPYHPTLSRPPLMPLLVAGLLRLHPSSPFATWRAFDAVAFAAAAAALVGAVRRRMGPYAGLAVLALALADPVRREFVPEWWTEGLAFDGVAVLVAMVLAGASPRAVVVGGGVTLGLLGLDRSLFALLGPGLSLVLGGSLVGLGWRRRLAVAMGTLAVAAAVQLPWWARNVAVSGRFLPLGTQGGMNLPDEYGDAAVTYDGRWTGHGLAEMWAAEPKTAAERARETSPAVLALWPGPDAATYAAAVDAQTCQSLATELRVADAGQRAAVAWARGHPGSLVPLFLSKVWMLTAYHRTWAAVMAAAAAVGLARSRDRRPLRALLAFVGVYAVGIGLTHVMVGRFLVPVLPAAYALAAAAAGTGSAGGDAAGAVSQQRRSEPDHRHA